MAVRRLADLPVQPDSFRFSPENQEWAEAQLGKFPEGRQQSAIIPLLMRAQEQEGWVTKAAIESVADMLDMPYIRALEVATFYTQFQLKPVGTRAHIQVCGTTPCMLRGAEALIDVCRSRIHAEPFQTNEDGTLSWEEVECQGACVNAPMVMIFKDAYEDLTPERLAEIIDAFEAGDGASVPPGPQNERHLSAPLGGPTTLLDADEAERPAETEEYKAAAISEDAEEPTEKGRPRKGRPPEGDPTIADPPEAEGAEGIRKTPDEAGAQPVKSSTSPRTPKASGKTQPLADEKEQAEQRPAAVERPDQPDDLKMISGIGLRIEERLNALGVWSFAQIAAWTPAECDWVDDHLRFSGRIERDNWISQAEALAKGGEAEYIRVFGKKPR